MARKEVSVSEWFKGITPGEGARRGVKRISDQRFRVGDRVTLGHNGKVAVVVQADPMMFSHSDDDWMYYVTEPGVGRYPVLGKTLKPAKP